MMNQTGPVTAEGMTVPTAVRSSPPGMLQILPEFHQAESPVKPGSLPGRTRRLRWCINP